MSVEVREAARALVLDAEGRCLLVRWVNEENDVDLWLTPGGGLDDAEDAAEALRRELREEVGLEEFEPGPVIWTRCHRFAWYERTVEQSEMFVLVRVPHFEPRPHPAAIALEGVREVRWWTLDELDASAETFAPRHLPALVRELVEHGPPAEPLDVGI